LFSTEARQTNNHSATIRDLITIYNFWKKYYSYRPKTSREKSLILLKVKLVM